MGSGASRAGCEGDNETGVNFIMAMDGRNGKADARKACNADGPSHTGELSSDEAGARGVK